MASGLVDVIDGGDRLVLVVGGPSRLEHTVTVLHNLVVWRPGRGLPASLAA